MAKTTASRKSQGKSAAKKKAPAKATAPRKGAPKPAARKPAPAAARKPAGKSSAPRKGADTRPRAVTPPEIAIPTSRYSMGMLHALGGRRLIVSGQVGMRPDGGIVDGLEGQWDQAFANLVAVLKAAGMGPANVVKLVAFSKVPRTVTVFRAARDKVFTADPPPASTYLEVAGLASPGFLCEVEAEAVAFD